MRILVTLGLLVATMGSSTWAASEAPDELTSVLAAGAVVTASIDDGDISYSVASREADRPSTSTRFEIGSITKAFTNILLAELVAKDVVSYTTTLADLLPGQDFSSAQVGAITLEQLATHTSGLPRLPANLIPRDDTDPYVDYGNAALLGALEHVRKGQTLQNEYAYSNLGVGLLGYLLGVADDSDYATALRKHVLTPLGIGGMTLECAGEDVAPGHSAGEPVSNWHFDLLAGAGALCGSAQHLATLMNFYLHPDTSPLTHALTDDLEPLVEAGNVSLTRVWHSVMRGGNRVYFHNGGTGGYRSFAGFSPATGRAEVILVSADMDVTAYGLNLFGEPDMSEPAEPASAASDQGQELEEYVGDYELTQQFILSVTREGDSLFVQLTGQPRLSLAAGEPDRFSLREVDAQLEFVRNDEGEIESVILHQNGAAQSAKRIASESGRSGGFEKISIDADILDDYLGQYVLLPGVILDVTREGDTLMVQLTGQQSFPVYPHAPDQFFYEVVFAQLTFNREEGDVVSVTLHQNGANQVAPRK